MKNNTISVCTLMYLTKLTGQGISRPTIYKYLQNKAILIKIKDLQIALSIELNAIFYEEKIKNYKNRPNKSK